MKPIVVVLVIAGVIVVIGLFGARQQLGFVSAAAKSEVNVQLTLQGGICKVKDPVETVGGAWKNKIKWTVSNVDCPEAQYTTFLEYRERLAGGGLGSPEAVVDPDPAYSNRIAMGASDPVHAKIDKFNWNPFSDWTYKYKICVGPAAHPTTNCLDPDVDVWPF